MSLSIQATNLAELHGIASTPQTVAPQVSFTLSNNEKKNSTSTDDSVLRKEKRPLKVITTVQSSPTESSSHTKTKLKAKSSKESYQEIQEDSPTEQQEMPKPNENFENKTKQPADNDMEKDQENEQKTQNSSEKGSTSQERTNNPEGFVLEEEFVPLPNQGN